MNGPTTSFLAGTSAIRNTAAPQVDKTETPENIRKAARDFEAFFLTQVMEYMFEGIETDGPFGGGFGEGIYRSFMLQEYGKSLAGAGGIGIADAVMKEIIKLQEVQ